MLISVLQCFTIYTRYRAYSVSKKFMKNFRWRWQAQCNTKDISDSLVSEVENPSRDGPYQGGFSEKKDEGDVLRSSKGLMQSRLTSLYSQGQQKVVESAPAVEGRMAISF